MALDAADIEYGLKMLADRQASDRKFHNYYEGLADLSFIPSRARHEVRRVLRGLNYNRCRGVVDALADRTTVTGWKSEGKTDAKATVQQMTSIWDRNRMDNRQNEIVKEAFRCGDGYVIVWPDSRDGPTKGLARIYPNRSHVVTVVYDSEEPDHVDFAVKCWRVDRGAGKGKWRVTTYGPDFVSRYITRSKSDEFPIKANKLVEFTDDGQFETDNPTPGIVPVVHFGNDADTGSFGTSELTDVVGLQDGLNNSIINRVLGEEWVSFRQKWAVGLEVEEDPVTGAKVAPFQGGMSKLWVAEDPNVKFGDFEASDMTQFLGIEDNWDMKIARVSRVPVHWLNQTGDFPSGEALKTAETPFVSKVKDRQGSFSDPYRQVAALALRIEGVADEVAASIVPVWMPAESRSEREKYEIAQYQKSIGVPDEVIWADLGKTPEEIAAMVELKNQAAQRQQDAFARALNGGDQQNQQGTI